MILGFTGTRHGMTAGQRVVVEDLVNAHAAAARGHTLQAHHGDCVGADAEFHRIVRRRGWQVMLHPPADDRWRAFCDYDLRYEPMEYLERNHAIVEICELLITTPAESTERRRSGTWATIRYARDRYRARVVINPDGLVNTDWSTA